MKFDVVVGNPPYQETRKDTSDAAVYNYFYDLSEKISRKYILVSPARFLFNAGGTQKKWNKKMLDDEHLKVVYYNQKSSQIFPNTDIKGGVAILYKNKDKKFGKIGTFTNYTQLNNIVSKVTVHEDFESIVSLIHLQEKFNLKILYNDYPNLKNKIGSQGREKRLTTSIFDTIDIFSAEKESENDIEIVGLVKNQRYKKFINRKYIESHPNLDKWKVILPKSNGSGKLGEVLSKPIIGKPLIGYTQSFISIGAFDSEYEVNSTLKYIKGKFSRALLGVLKITQDNNPSTWSKVPLQDFTSNSDIDWTKSISEVDQQLYKKYQLDEDEINFIESKVKPME